MIRFFLAMTLGGFLCIGCEGYGDAGLYSDAAYSSDASTQFGSEYGAIKTFPPVTLKCGDKQYVKFDSQDPLEGEGTAKKRADASRACYQSLRDLATDATTCDVSECAKGQTCHPGSQWTSNMVGRCKKGKDENGNKQWTCKCKVLTMKVWCTKCKKPKPKPKPVIIPKKIGLVDEFSIDDDDHAFDEFEGAAEACDLDQ